MRTYRITIGFEDPPEGGVNADAVAATLATAFPGSIYQVEQISGNTHTQNALKNRLDLPRDQKIYLSLAHFIQTSPRFDDQMFRLDAHRGVARVELIEPASKSALRSRSYAYETSDEHEIVSLEAAIAADFAVGATTSDT